MDTHTSSTRASDPRQDAWAKPVDRLHVPGVPPGALNLNVEGRQLAGPLDGFGQMWQKTYRASLRGASASPGEVIRVWKENFGRFWPKGNRFYPTLPGIVPGEVALLNLAGPGGLTGPGGMPVFSTGILVIYADDESFTFMNPEGHPFAGWITFSAFEEDGATVAQVQVLVRASDPLIEATMRLGLGHRMEDSFWHHTLRSLAAHFGVQAKPQQKVVRVDPKVQWSKFKNVWHNNAIRTGLYALGAPFRWARRALGG
jgi:hypothetical protein